MMVVGTDKALQDFLLESHQGGDHCPCHSHVCATESKAGCSLIGWVRLLMRQRSWVGSALRACECHSDTHTVSVTQRMSHRHFSDHREPGVTARLHRHKAGSTVEK